MKGRILLLAAILFIPSNLAFATLGPVHVELNMIKPKLSAARANSLTAFKVHFRFNTNIKIYDWIKLWLPIYESDLSDIPEEIPTKICDGLGDINEAPNVRFIPNEVYFKKFENSKIKGVGGVYEVKDSKGNTEFYQMPDLNKYSNWEDVCGNKKPRLVKDPSGLGCWLLGTILPPMPFDSHERYERIATMDRSMVVGYSPCTCKYPIIINDCKQSSIQFFVPLEIEAWRKGYNSLDFNTSKNTGIIAPATPGRYTLAIATTPEPEPVESEAFVLPCSDISDVKCKVVNDLLYVDFKTGEGGALDGGSSLLTLGCPPEVVLPKKFLAKTIKINGSYVSSAPSIDVFPDHNELKLVLPSDIPNLGTGKIEFLENSGITFKKLRGKIKISLSSSSEPNFIESDEFSAFQPYTLVNPRMELAPSAIRIRALVPESKPYPKDAAIVLNFPDGFKLPAQPNTLKVFVNNKPLEKPCKVEGQTLTISSPVPIDFNLDIEIQNGSGLTNPGSGTYKIAITTDGTSLDAGEFEITESKALVSNLMLSSEQAALACTYEFDYQPSIKNLPDVGDIFSIIFPEGTKLPTDPDPSKVTIDGKKVISIGTSNNILKIGSPVKFVFGKWIHFLIDCEIYNTRKHGEYSISIGFNQDDPVKSDSFILDPAPLKSWIYFKDPDKPNCGEWFNKPPILGFDCLNPDAKISFWFNNHPDKSVDYGGETRMYPGSQRATITWQAQFAGTIEEPQTFYFNLDTISPILSIFEPKSDITRINEKTFTIKGERGFTEMLTDGDNTKYQVVDSVFLRFNGEETRLLEGEIYETASSGSIKYDFEKTINLQEGENIVEIIGRDQACNETILKKKIVLDTTPPDFEIISPKEPYDFTENDAVTVTVKTEAGAIVFINNQYIDPMPGQQEDVLYSTTLIAAKGLNTITVEVSDATGNKSTKTITFTVKPKQTVIFLTMDKTKWTVNGITQTPLKTAPTNKFPNNLKKLNGNAYMPISEIARLLDSWISWDAKEKKVTITQRQSDGTDKTIEMWISKTTARINGREMKYDSKGILFPAIINGKTMLPLRFVAENLGADVTFDAKEKTITIVYPKGGR